MKKTLLWVLAIALTNAGACSSSSGERPARVKLSEVDVNVSGWNDVRVGATLIDRNGRRTGWNVDRPIREIKGCVHEYWSDEGIPDETVPDTPEQTTAADTVPGSQSMPIHHFFRIYNDVVTPVGLIDQGGCELQLDPVVDGKAQLALVATVIGLGGCSDTTSIWVKPGLPSRLWLSWKPAGDKCVVKISRMALRQTRSPAR